MRAAMLCTTNDSEVSARLSAHCVDEQAAFCTTATSVANFADNATGSIEPIAYPSKILNQGRYCDAF